MKGSWQGDKLSIPFSQAVQLVASYCRTRFFDQIKAVLPVVLYLVFFQTMILGLPISESLLISSGIMLVILGLTFFLEGLILGLMPLGEIIGFKLPLKLGLMAIILFSFVLGLGATLAEPSINILRAAGTFVKPWDAPLLYLILNKYAEYLVAFVGIGVGLAVIAGMMRFMYEFSLKPFIYFPVAFLLVISLWGIYDKNILYLTALAWDCGAVTTGPVTVPLVLALGIGICRSVGGKDSGTMGFGVVTLASLFPIISVMLFGLFLSLNTPAPMSEEQFFSGENREAALHILDSVEVYEEMKRSVSASSNVNVEQEIPFSVFAQFISSFIGSVRAILPLTIFLLFVLLVVLREKLSRKDEVFFGIIIAFLGMGFFNIGVELGLSKIGVQVGSKLPLSFKSIEIVQDQEFIKNFDSSIVYQSIDSEGDRSLFFYKKGRNGFTAVPYEEDNFDAVSSTYHFIPRKGPLFGESRGKIGFAVVILFAFIMGYGATLAEPALNALGMKVEELTIGTFKKTMLMQAVAVGVGMGLAVGATKIIWDIPIIWFLIPFYVMLLLLTKISGEEFVNIAWDSAGVTTGPITVPLVLAMGLGIGTQVGVVEGFGILSMASACPILAVLTMGIYSSRNTAKLLRSSYEDDRKVNI